MFCLINKKLIFNSILLSERSGKQTFLGCLGIQGLNFGAIFYGIGSPKFWGKNPKSKKKQKKNTLNKFPHVMNDFEPL